MHSSNARACHSRETGLDQQHCIRCDCVGAHQCRLSGRAGGERSIRAGRRAGKKWKCSKPRDLEKQAAQMSLLAVIGMQERKEKEGGRAKMSLSYLCKFMVHESVSPLTSAKSFESHVSLRTYTWTAHMGSIMWVCNPTSFQAVLDGHKSCPSASCSAHTCAHASPRPARTLSIEKWETARCTGCSHEGVRWREERRRKTTGFGPCGKCCYIRSEMATPA